jgi:hypothetical protein
MSFAEALLIGTLVVAWSAPVALHRLATGRHDALTGV